MSQENVQVVRRIWELYAQGTPAAVAATYDEGLLAPDSTFTPAEEVPGKETYVGREGFMKFLRGWDAEFGEWSLQVEEIIDAGDNRVVVLLREFVQGRRSGVPVEAELGSVYRFKGGQVIERRDYLGHTRPSTRSTSRSRRSGIWETDSSRSAATAHVAGEAGPRPRRPWRS
jgi:ketosteroid isomerase-like protein